MAAQRLRPLGVGEILDAAIKVYRMHFATLLKAVVLVVAPVQVLVSLVSVSLPSFSDASKVDAFGQTTFDAATFRGAAAAFLIILLLGFVAAQLATATSLKVISSAYVGEAEDWRGSLRFATRRLPSLIWLALLIAVLGVLGLILCVIPGVYFLFAWSVSVPVLLLEDERGWKALRRSRQLVKGRWWPVFGCIIIGMLLAGIVASVFQAIVLGVVLNTSNELAQTVAYSVAAIAASALVTPFTAAITALVYFDLRVRKEGFDIELLARTMGVEPPRSVEPPRAGDGTGDGTGEQPPFWPPPPDWRPREG